MKLLAISGSPSSPSKTVLALSVALARGAEHDDVHTDLLDLREQELVFSDGRDPADYTGASRRAIDDVVAADALLVGTPMYRGGYTGRLKNLFDLLPNDALAGKPVGLVATGGTDHHFLALEHELKPLVGFFRAWAVPEPCTPTTRTSRRRARRPGRPGPAARSRGHRRDLRPAHAHPRGRRRAGHSSQVRRGGLTGPPVRATGVTSAPVQRQEADTGARNLLVRR